MKTFSLAGALITIGLLFSSLSCSAAIYTGNAFIDPSVQVIAGGTLTITESGYNNNNVNLTFARGPGYFNDALVIYFDVTAGSGFRESSLFGDTLNLETRCISGLGTAGRSTVNFASGFTADYALVLGVNSFLHGLYRLGQGGDESMTLVRNLNFNPYGPNDAQFNTSFTWADLGLGSSSTRGFRFQSTYLTTTGSRYLETFEHLTPDSLKGFNSIWFSDYNLYGVDPVPEPTNLALAVFGGLALTGTIATRFRRWFAARRLAIAGQQ
jgi:hypothetical protein